MDVKITLKSGDPVQLEEIHLYGSMAVPDFISFFQRIDDFDPENPIATKGFHFSKREVVSFETQSDEIDVEETKKRLAAAKEAQESDEWDLKQLEN